MPLAGRRVDRVARPDLEDLAAAGLRPPDPVEDVERLADGVDVPRVAGPGREADDARADARRRIAADDQVHPGVARERLGGRLRGRRLGQDLHGDLHRLGWLATEHGPGAGIALAGRRAHALVAPMYRSEGVGSGVGALPGGRDGAVDHGGDI